MYVNRGVSETILKIENLYCEQIDHKGLAIYTDYDTSPGPAKTTRLLVITQNFYSDFVCK